MTLRILPPNRTAGTRIHRLIFGSYTSPADLQTFLADQSGNYAVDWHRKICENIFSHGRRFVLLNGKGLARG